MSTIAVYGLGDLGERIAIRLACSDPSPRVLWLLGRNREALEESARVVRLTAACVGLAPDVRTRVLPLEATDEAAQSLSGLHLDALVFAATRLTWWRAQHFSQAAERLLTGAGFGVYLSVNLDLLLRMERILAQLPERPWFVVVPFPDVTAPILARVGAKRLIGVGNVDEIAEKVRLDIAEQRGASLDQVRVRLIAHHSVQPPVFGSPGPLPPHIVRAEVARHAVPAALWPPWTWPQGTRSHAFTAASTCRLLGALGSEEPIALHAPAPHGLPGGYPLSVSRAGVDLDLPTDVTKAQAAAVNEAAQRCDGIEAILDDGTAVYTEACAAALKDVFGIDQKALAPADAEAAADEFIARFKEVHP